MRFLAVTGLAPAGCVLGLAVLLAGGAPGGSLAGENPVANPAESTATAEPAAPSSAAPALHMPTEADTSAALTGLASPTAAAAPSANAAPSPTTTASIGAPAGLDPILVEIRARLAEPVRAAAQDRDDRQALANFYRDRAEPPLWTSPEGLTARALAVVGEIAKADDWGLSAKDFALPDLRTAGRTDAGQRADEEIKIGLAILKYAQHARGGRLDPSRLSRFFDQMPPLKPDGDVLQEIAAATSADAYLRALHPQHLQFELLRQALIKARSGKADAAPAPTEPDPSVRVPDGPSLKPGQEHASVVPLRLRLGVPAETAEQGRVYDARLVDAVTAFQREREVKVTGTLDRTTRAALNKSIKLPAGNDPQRLIANMERWRWLPADMGEFHVWDNIPEYATRVVRKGEVIHQARIIVGKPETQTPLFSADMRYIVFHPGWGVPDSIKVKELLPYLRPTQSFFGFGETDTTVLQRHNLVVSLNGRPVDPRGINWQQTDIRRYQFVQPPGASNVLGVLKFRFPNKHDVYMHDTSQRELFARGQRTYSHGCVRVDNPRRLAEILLDHDRGMPASEVGRLIASGPKDNQIELKTKIPVHITYFTAVAEADGTIRTHADIYGHDTRVTSALGGRPMALEPAQSSTPVARREPRQGRPVKQAAQSSDFFSGLFGN